MDSFASAQEFCEFIGVSVPSDLARIQAMLRMASAEIRGYCCQTLSFVEDDVVMVYPRMSSLLTLPERPVVTVAEVEVDGVVTTDYYVVPRGIRSGTVASPGAAWLSGATVTYDHGYVEFSTEYDLIKSVCIDAAARAFTMNERSASEVLGSSVLESAGYAPEVFLTPGEKQKLRRFQRGPVR